MQEYCFTMYPADFILINADLVTIWLKKVATYSTYSFSVAIYLEEKVGTVT